MEFMVLCVPFFRLYFAVYPFLRIKVTASCLSLPVSIRELAHMRFAHIFGCLLFSTVQVESLFCVLTCYCFIDFYSWCFDCVRIG